MAPKNRQRSVIGRSRVDDRYASDKPALTPQQRKQQLIAARWEVSGPLPSADELERYAALMPDMPERLVANWERQTAHRMTLERTVIEGDEWRSKWGLRLGWVFAISLLAASVYLIVNGFGTQGVLVFLTEMIGLGAALLYTDVRRRQERKQKQ